jgi:hypothetical protein
MDNTFASLSRQYHDNYLQYVLTANPSYQSAYQTAQEGLDKLIQGLESEVNTDREQVSSFFKEDVEGRLRDLRGKSLKEQHGLLETKDQITAARRRMTPPALPAEQSYKTQYIILGSLAGAALLLSFV